MRFSTSTLGANYHFQPKSVVDPNHLGNVLTVVSDRKIAVSLAGTPTVVDHYNADIISSTDYYAFGAPMPGRNFNSSSYKYGFNGKENDREVTSTGSGTQDYGLRIYNPSLGKFLSVDPLTNKFPWWSPYHFAGNMPIKAIDLDGAEIFFPLEMPMEPILTLPRIVPMPPLQGPMPPIVGPVPDDITVGAPKNDAVPMPPIDWENSPPSSPNDLGSDWDETTHPDNNSGSRDFKNKNNDETIRYDPGKSGKPGWEGKDHWHRNNPNRNNKLDEYLDKYGNPVARGSDASHIPAPKTIQLPQIIVKPIDNRNILQKGWDKIKDFFKSEPKENKSENKLENDPSYT